MGYERETLVGAPATLASPHTLAPYPERTLLDCICDTACERPDHPFLLFKGRTLPYGEVEQLSNQIAAALVSEGVQKGDRVALILTC